MQRMETANKCFLFVCGDIELNPGPVNISHMSILTTRLQSWRKILGTLGKNHTFFSFYSRQGIYMPSLFSKHDHQTPLPSIQCCGRDLQCCLWFGRLLSPYRNIVWGEGGGGLISLKREGVQGL